jgi:threonyl-tRNA synthetase
VSNLIKIQLPDGSVREVPRGTTPFDIANSISPRLAAVVVVARVKPLTPVAVNANEAALEASEERSTMRPRRLSASWICLLR